MGRGINGTLGAIAATCIQLLAKAGRPESDSEAAPSTKTIAGWEIPAEFKGIAERGVVAEAALQTIMAMPKASLDTHQVFDRLKASVKQVAPTMRKLDAALVQILGPVITQLVIDELRKLKGIAKTKGKPKKKSTPKSVAAKTDKTTSATNGAAAKTGLESETVETNDEGDNELDSQVESFIDAIGGSEAGSDELTPSGFAEMVRLAMNANECIAINDSGTEALESFFGDELSGSNDQETDAPAESDEGLEESYDKISGLAQRVMLAEAALQVIVTLPAEALEPESEAGLGAAVGLAKAAARIAKLVKKYGPKIWVSPAGC